MDIHRALHKALELRQGLFEPVRVSLEVAGSIESM